MQKSFILIAVSFAFPSFVFSSSYRRIFNGRDAKENEFPFLANVRAAGSNCGGALLNRKFVITAAHCLMDLVEGQQITVILGDRNYYSYKTSPKVIKLRGKMKFWMHEKFSMPSAEHDLAIIELSQPVEFSDNIKPLNISKDAFVDKLDDKVLAVTTGWGLKESYEPANVLQAAEMKLIPIDDCMKFQNHFVETITKNHLCGSGFKSEPKHVVSACDGDSGSPLVLASTGELIGITSFVKDLEDGKPLRRNDCASNIAPTVYVRVASYLDWIGEKTGYFVD